MDFNKKDGFNYLDDVPFKVSSQFLPPPCIILPTSINLSEESLQEFNYDFTLEKKILESAKSKEMPGAASKEKDARESISSFQEHSGTKSVQDIFSYQSDILLPKLKNVSDKITDSNSQVGNKINLSDFENDTSSPFDYMELQTINDLEELSNVFQGLNNKCNSDNNVYKDTNCSSNNVNSDDSIASNVSKSVSFPLQSSEAFMDSSLSSGYMKQNTYGKDKDFTIAVDCNQSFPCVSTASAIDPNLRLQMFITQPEVPSNTLLNSKTVADNYSLNLNSKTSLRGSKSYSDIPNVIEGYNDMNLPRSCTPPSHLHSKSDTLPPLVPSENVSCGNNCDNSQFTLPDPYEELNEAERKVVIAITDMGFPRPQVSRTVKHLGTDEKTIVEHLCQIQTLEESGYDSLEAEAALHLHDYNEEQAKKFLDLIVKFQDLGFEKNAVKKALIQNKNDWGKTIDALLL